MEQGKMGKTTEVSVLILILELESIEKLKY